MSNNWTRAAIILENNRYSVIFMTEPTDGIHDTIDWYKVVHGPGFQTEEYKTIGTYKFTRRNCLWSFSRIALRFEWKTGFPKESLFKILQQAFTGRSYFNYKDFEPTR